MGGQPTKARGPRENPQRGKYASKKGKKEGNKGKNKGNKKKYRENKGRRARRQGKIDCSGDGDIKEPTRIKRERWLPRWRMLHPKRRASSHLLPWPHQHPGLRPIESERAQNLTPLLNIYSFRIHRARATAPIL